MSVNVIGGLAGLMCLFGLVVCIIGNSSFAAAFKSEYESATYRMAAYAATNVNGNHIDLYLEGAEAEEYALMKRQLDLCCEKMHVSLIYVIKPEKSDYGRFVSIVNSVNNSVDNSNYTEWELGYQRDTTNDEYRDKYRELYENGSDYETVFRMHPKDGHSPHITTMVPVKAASGEVTAILCMQRPVSEMAKGFVPYLIFIALSVLIMVIVISILASNFLHRLVIDPVEKVSKEAVRFANEKDKGEPLGDLGKYDTLLNLGRSVESMEKDMLDYIDNLTTVTAEKEKISAELSIAAKIQEDSLPDVFPAFPDRHEFDIYAIMNPAKEVGGDFYNFFFVDEDHLVLVIADVSGKGIPGALFMMVSNTVITDRTLMGGTPAEILSFVNDNICEHNTAGMFVTVWLGILEVSTGKMVYADAGHEYPAICRKDGSFTIIKDRHSFVIGGMEGVKYKDNDLLLSEGDKLFLYTDGVPEAMNEDDEMYNVDRMVEALNEHKKESPEEILKGVQYSVSQFVGNADQFDDLTMLCLEYKGGAVQEPDQI